VLFFVALQLTPAQHLQLTPATQPQQPKSDQQARHLVESAVKALGGLDKLTLPGGTIRSVKGSYPGEAFLGETYSQTPDLLKLTARSVPGALAKPDRFMLIKGQKAWLRLDGQLIMLDEVEMKGLKRARHADKVSGLVTLLRDQGYTLTGLGAAKVKGQDSLGINVQFKGQPDIQLHFDKATGLLVKTWQKFIDPLGDDGTFVIHECYYSDYQRLDPVGKETQLLKDAQLPVNGPGLVGWLRARTPSAQTRAQAAKLIQDLASNSFATRTKASAELKKLGPEMAPLLRQALPTAESEALLRLEQCLAHYAKDPAVQQVPAALRVLALTKPAGAAAAVLHYLPSAPTETIRDEALAALYDLGQAERDDPALVQALQDADPIRRDAAKTALGKDGGEYARKPGRRLLIDGLQMATRCDLHRNGKLDLRLDVLQIQYFNALDEKLFALPQ
jgi:hypothetical protein